MKWRNMKKNENQNAPKSMSDGNFFDFHLESTKAETEEESEKSDSMLYREKGKKQRHLCSK